MSTTPTNKELALAADAAEAMRRAVLNLLGTSDMRHGGEHRTADTYDTIAARVHAIDLSVVLAAATGAEPTAEEDAAFAEAARATSFNPIRKDNGTYLHPITIRARALWDGAVRWARRVQPPHECPGACETGPDCTDLECPKCHCVKKP